MPVKRERERGERREERDKREREEDRRVIMDVVKERVLCNGGGYS